MFFDFQTKTPVLIILYAGLYSTSKICVEKPKESLKTQSTCQLSLFFFVVSYGHADSVAVRSNHFLLVEWLFDAKLLLNGHAVTQNYVFVVFQSEATNWSDTLKTIVIKIFMQFRTSDNYMAGMSDCMIEICNTHTITFGYQRHSFLTIYLDVTFSMKCPWLFTVSIWYKSHDGKHRNENSTGEHCFF